MKSKAHTHFRLSEVAKKQLDELTPQHLSFRARIEFVIHMAWTLHKKWLNKEEKITQPPPADGERRENQII